VDWADVSGIRNARRTKTEALISVKFGSIALIVALEDNLS
jgi:hypothetical protein